MTDWKGNEISIGDTLHIVATRDDDGKYAWHVLETISVSECSGTPCYAMRISPTSFLVLDIYAINLHLHETDIICIEGKSDSEIEYYLKYFEVT